MKKLFTIVGILGMSALSYGQECKDVDEANFGTDENECKKNISLYSEHLKNENFKDAAHFWWATQAVCPQYKTNLYKNGNYIYTKLAKEAKKNKDKEDLAKKADTLFIIYDLWMENFGVCDKIEVDYADDIMSFKKEDYEKAYNKYEKSFTKIDESKVKATSVQYYFLATYTMVQTKKAECDALLDKYDLLSGVCERKIKNGNERDQKNFKNVLAFLDKYVAPCAGCDKLEELFKPKFEADPENVELMEKIVTMMGNRKCSEGDFYFNVVVALDAKKPSFKSKKGIALKYYSDKNYGKAMGYFEQAVEMTEDESEKESLYRYLANSALQKGSGKTAVKWGEKIGGSEYYAIKAQAIARSASSCGSSTVERSFAYCLALDYAEKSGGKVSSSTMNAWKQRLASTQDLFFEGYEVGKSVSVSCWGESTKIRAKE